MSVLDQAREEMALAVLRIWQAGEGQDITSLELAARKAYELAIGRHKGYLAPFRLSNDIWAAFEQPMADEVTIVLYRDPKELHRHLVTRLGGGDGPLGDARHYANSWSRFRDLGAQYRGARKAPPLIARVEQMQHYLEAWLRWHMRVFDDEFDGMSQAEQGIRAWQRRGERHIEPLVRALTT